MLRGLRRHEVEFIVFGALAMLFYGYARSTQGLDLVVAPEQANLDRVADSLMSIDAVYKL